jgi:isopentenyl-diphosphate Delta-isomerase
MKLVAEAPVEAKLIDIVDLQGEPTGRVEAKDLAHEQGLWHRDVHVWVTDGEHFLEQQRVWSKTIMPGVWDISASGHVAASESYADAAARETEEELGLRFNRSQFRPAGRLAVEMAMQDGAWMHRTVSDNFVVMAPGLRLEDLRLQASEVLAARLYPIDVLEADIMDPAHASRHAPQPPALWHLGIAAMREATA